MEKPFSSTKKQPVNDNGAFDQVGPPSAFANAPSSSNRPRLCCDVFINHRGPDVKHTVAKAIHDKLYRMGLQVFLDEKQGIPYQPKYRRQWMMLLLYEIKIDDWGWVLEGLAYRVVMAIKGLSRCDTKKLLCSHAFQKSDCQGLPLSLKVFGGQLFSKPRDYWESQLNEISRALPKGILRSVKISYDALDLEEQGLFLDIACFFIAEIKSLGPQSWQRRGVYSWETLQNKCLVEFDKKNRIRMHDYLRDLGREIANKKLPYLIRFEDQINIIHTQVKERI